MTRTTKPWRELAPWQKIALVIISAVQVTLLGAALWDIRQRQPQEINGTKELWTVISFINFIGPVSYFLFGIKRQPGQTSLSSSSPNVQAGGG